MITTQSGSQSWKDRGLGTGNGGLGPSIDELWSTLDVLLEFT
jgi:hypothetical protein